MSYSFYNPCTDCKKNVECTDRHVIYGAISAIHSMPYGVGHIGSGIIRLDCAIKEPKGENE